MGARGPKPGFKAARAAALADGEQPTKPASKKVPAVKPAPPADVTDVAPRPVARAKEVAQVRLSAADRENPAKITGQALRDLAHRRGLSRSELDRIGDDDDKIREQLRYVTARVAEEELG